VTLLSHLNAFERAIELGRDTSEEWTNLGDSLRLSRQYREAELAYRAALKKDQENAKAWNQLGVLLAAMGGRREEAESALSKATHLSPDKTEYLFDLGDFLADRRETRKKSEEIFREILARDPKYTNAWAGLINVLRLKGEELGKVSSEYARAIVQDLERKWRVTLAYAIYLDNVHEHGRAEKLLVEASQIYPETSRVWFTLGQHYSQFSDKKFQAIDAYKTAIKLSPERSQYWARLGDVLSAVGEKGTDAENALRKAVAIDPQNCGPLHSLGEYLAKMNQLEEAHSCFEKALDLNPKCECSAAGMATLMSRQQRSANDIRQFLQVIMEQMPDSPNPNLLLAKHLLVAERNPAASRRELKRAGIQFGSYPPILIQCLLATLRRP
jgi:tetratricopeptide (TPR) repeat protein